VRVQSRLDAAAPRRVLLPALGGDGPDAAPRHEPEVTEHVPAPHAAAGRCCCCYNRTHRRHGGLVVLLDFGEASLICMFACLHVCNIAFLQTLRAVGGCETIEQCLAVECAPCSPNGLEGESDSLLKKDLDGQSTKLDNASCKQSLGMEKGQYDVDSDSETPPLTPMRLTSRLFDTKSQRTQLPPIAKSYGFANRRQKIFMSQSQSQG
jgi:hypothetical protein